MKDYGWVSEKYFLYEAILLPPPPLHAASVCPFSIAACRKVVEDRIGL